MFGSVGEVGEVGVVGEEEVGVVVGEVFEVVAEGVVGEVGFKSGRKSRGSEVIVAEGVLFFGGGGLKSESEWRGAIKGSQAGGSFEGKGCMRLETDSFMAELVLLYNRTAVLEWPVCSLMSCSSMP